MIKESEPVLERLIVFFQVLLTLACFFFSIWLSAYFGNTLSIGNEEYYVMAFLIAPIWFVLLELFELGAMARIQRFRHLIKKYIGVVAIGITLLFALTFLLDYDSLPRSVFIIFAIVNFIVLFSQKVLGRTIMKYFRNRGYNTRMILLIADDSSADFIEQLRQSPYWGYLIGGIITNSTVIREKYKSLYTIIPEEEDFSKVIDEKVIDEVFFCKNNFKTSEVIKFVSMCREVGVIFHLHSDVFSFSGLHPHLTFLNHQFFLSFRNTPENYLAFKLKRGIDYLLAFIVLILFSPFMLLISVLIKLGDGGPVFFRQTRVGKHGRHFTCLKFRTMVVNAEEMKEQLMSQNEQDGPVFKIKKDPRVTKVGRFLRKTSLDEMPQFFNILMGDMSIVGPRPPIPEEVKQYKRSLNRRLSIPPGITCIWQISGRNNIPFNKWMEMDMQYIDNWSLKLDFIIMAKTFRLLFNGNGQ
ncbi:Undecaprenyl-phosphate galactosephosphotransferase [hydrothermal vent metagenome]|uniref:Undecaprenyl-phosphate galactosephosphotransferase n=1 Tax=hydrothermal vent metagenome TaxID=652676 RepID=A0A3B0U580_9ZZZZ